MNPSEASPASPRGTIGTEVAAPVQGRSTRDHHFYEELSRTNNELANLQREMARKNAELAAASATLQKTSEQLARSRDMLQVILETIPSRVFWKDRALNYMGCNSSFARDAGFEKPDEIIGKDDFVLGWKAHAEAYRADDRHVMENGLAELKLIEPQTTPTGEIIWLSTSKLPLRNSDGETIGVLGIYEDITAKQQAEAERVELNKQLVAASRRAGMADVATSVLHNVGNVLNSVNVSAALASGKIRASSSSQVRKVADLLSQNSDDLPAYFATPQGTKLPAFLGTLAARLDQEQQAVLGELDSLSSNIDHIKSVVATQQAFARVGGVMEEVSPLALVEDALKLDEASLKRHGVEVIRDYAETPLVRMDKHKALEILLNLIRNAKQAIEALQSTQSRRLTLGVSHNDNAVTITVGDEGIGIAAENLTRIFAHGFTTRADGHGFGLHSAALSAQEMGGSLTASSEGIGHGATFKLCLPFRRQETES